VYQNSPETVDPGVFGLAHLWFDDGSSPPLGRTRRALYHATGQDDVEEVAKVRRLGIAPETQSVGVDLGFGDIQALKERIDDELQERLEEIQAGQVGGAFKQGAKISVEQEKLLQYLELRLMNNTELVTGPSGDPIEVGEWAAKLHERLNGILLANTDEDYELRQRFRIDGKALTDWETEAFLAELQDFLHGYIEDNPDFQSTLAGANSAAAGIFCWGIVTAR